MLYVDGFVPEPPPAPVLPAGELDELASQGGFEADDPAAAAAEPAPPLPPPPVVPAGQVVGGGEGTPAPLKNPSINPINLPHSNVEVGELAAATEVQEPSGE